MKRIFSYILIIAGVTLYSCSEEFLERTPLDQISDPDFWQSEADLELFLNNFYDNFEGWWVSGGGAAPTYDRGTDLALPNPNVYGNDWTIRLDGSENIPASASNDYWNWTSIRNINYFLENATRVEAGGSMTEHFIGEGHFLRAWYYFDLMKTFGDLPIYTEPIDSENEELLYSARADRTEVFDFILSDIDMAISKMKNSSELTTPGTRLSKDIALMFKARATLYEGTWEKYHQGSIFEGETDGMAYLQQSAAAAKQIIDDGNFALVTGDPNSVYADLFNKTDYAGNPEVLFYKHFDREEYGSNFSNQLWNWPNGYGLTQDLTRFYLSEDGLPIAVSPLFEGDSTLAIVENNRDPRLAQTLMVPGDILRIDGTDTTYYTTPDVFNSGTAMESQKFRHIVIDPAAGIENGSVDYILMRYAEALLIYAEAKAELGELTQADVDMTINMLRDRVGMPSLVLANITPDPNWPDYGYTVPDYLHEVRRERTVELYGEGFRFDDLMRWRAHEYLIGRRFIGTYFTEELRAIDPNMPVNDDGYLDPLMNILTGPNNGYGFDPERDYLMPIPTNELTLNENLNQNPGW